MKKHLLPLVVSSAIAPVALAQVEPLLGYASSVEVRRAHVTERLFDNGLPQTGGGLSLGARYLDRSISQEVDRDTEGYGIRLGYTRPWENVRFGFSLDFEDVQSNFAGNTLNLGVGRVDTTSYTGAASSVFTFGEWIFLAEGGAGWSDYESRRDTVFGRKVADFDGSDFFALARIERNFALANAFSLKPFLGASGSWVRVDTFDESVGPDARTILGDSRSEYLGTAGVQLGQTPGRWSWFATAGWVQRLNSSDFQIRRTLRQDPAGQEQEPETAVTPYSGLLVGEFGITAWAGRGWSFTPLARVMAGRDDTRWSASIRAGYDF